MTMEDTNFSEHARADDSDSPHQLAEEHLDAETFATSTHTSDTEFPLSHDSELYAQLIATSPDAMLVECEGKIVFANQAAASLFAVRKPKELLGQSMQSLAPTAGRMDVAAVEQSLVQDKPPHSTEEQVLRIDGLLVHVAMTRLSITYRDTPATYIIARDISDRKRLESRLQHQATHDALTGLPNRNLLLDRLQLAIADAKRHKARLIVAFVDLDRFKWVNDSFGHGAGDTLLKTVSRRMSACLRESDTIARISGDEFVLVLREASDNDDPMQVLDRVVTCVSKPISVATNEITVTCSMGYCTYPEDGEDPEALLRFSDAAMYRAKEMGRNNMQPYNAEVQHRFDERIKIASELRHAIGRDQFELHYQLQVDLGTGAITGLEALLRWRHPTLGNIPPSRFLPIAEETGLIAPISDWVIRQACMQNKMWQEAGLAPVRVAVNLSAKELVRPGLEARVSRCLSDAQLDPIYLELEVTESASMENPDKTVSLMYKLKDLGIGLSIDNFGKGYSNMHYLQRFPVEKIKLDGSCVREITTNPDSYAVTGAMVSVAHRLGRKVVAEMTETESQMVLLAACGCDQIQGHYVSMPVSADECAELLRVGSIELGTLAHRNPPMLWEQRA